MSDKNDGPVKILIRVPRQKVSELHTIRLGGTPVLVMGDATRGMNHYQLVHRIDRIGKRSVVQPILFRSFLEIDKDKDVIISSKSISNLEEILKLLGIPLTDTERVF